MVYIDRLLPQFAAIDFAPDLPPNPPERRKNLATQAGFRPAVLGFLKWRGGDSNPRYRLRGTTIFETAAFNRSPTSSRRITISTAR